MTFDSLYQRWVSHLRSNSPSTINDFIDFLFDFDAYMSQTSELIIDDDYVYADHYTLKEWLFLMDETEKFCSD